MELGDFEMVHLVTVSVQTYNMLLTVSGVFEKARLMCMFVDAGSHARPSVFC